MEEPYGGYAVDITVRCDSILSLVELKSPWDDRAHTKKACIREFKKDLTKHLGRLHLGEAAAGDKPGGGGAAVCRCYSLWILHGSDEGSIKTTFEFAIKQAFPSISECDLKHDVCSSLLMDLNLNKQVQQVFAVEISRC